MTFPQPSPSGLSFQIRSARGDIQGPVATFGRRRIVDLAIRDTDKDEQWLLYMPAHRVVTYRADGHYQSAASNAKPSEDVWQSRFSSDRRLIFRSAGPQYRY